MYRLATVLLITRNVLRWRGNGTRARRAQPARQGAALLVCIFVIGATSLLAVAVLDTQTSQFAAMRNSLDYERALYLAGAGAHHALAEIEQDFTWRGTVSEGSYPADNTYQATAADGSGETIVVTSSGVAGNVTRSLQVTIASE